MNCDDICRMAREAGAYTPERYPDEFRMDANDLERFASLIAAAEREACAKLCDAECNPTPYEGHITSYQAGGYIVAEYLATAIRARGQ